MTRQDCTAELVQFWASLSYILADRSFWWIVMSRWVIDHKDKKDPCNKIIRIASKSDQRRWTLLSWFVVLTGIWMVLAWVQPKQQGVGSCNIPQPRHPWQAGKWQPLCTAVTLYDSAKCICKLSDASTCGMLRFCSTFLCAAWWRLVTLHQLSQCFARIYSERWFINGWLFITTASNPPAQPPSNKLYTCKCHFTLLVQIGTSLQSKHLLAKRVSGGSNDTDWTADCLENMLLCHHTVRSRVWLLEFSLWFKWTNDVCFFAFTVCPN